MSDERGPVLRAVGSSPPRDIRDMAQKNGEAYSVHVSKILEKESTAIDFLVPGCLPRGNIALISGESGAKKSWVAYDLARAVSSGTGWLGKNNMPCPAGPLSTMILNYDNPTETLRTRLKKLGFSSNDECYVHTLGYTKPYLAGKSELLFLPEEEKRLQYMLEYRKPALIVFDSFRQGVTLDENDSKMMAAVMNIFKGWMKINNTTVVLIHHTGKGEKKSGGWTANARGSGEIIASSDVVIEVEMSGEMTWTKSRTWDVGSTKKVQFEVIDEFKDGEVRPIEVDEDGIDESELREVELIQKVLVRAKSPLPFELELKAIDRVCEELAKSKLPYMNFKTIKTRVGKDIKDDSSLKTALKNARLLGRARFVQDGKGRGYVLREATN